MNTSHLPLKYGNATLTMAGWFLTIPSKKKDADNQDVFIASPIVITARFIDPNSKVEKIILSDFNHAELIEEADILSSQKLPTIIKFGFNVNEKYIRDLGFILQQMRAQTPLSPMYQGVGVINTENYPIISLDEPYVSKKVLSSLKEDILCDTQYDLRPKGTFEGWWQMYLDEVKGNLLLELAVTFGVSSLVTAFLKSKHEVEFSGTIFSFMGNSSTGKSTAAALAVSIAGNPTKGSNTLFRSWNGTRNALEGYLSNNYGLPIVLDELSAATFKDTTGLLYSLAEGQGRQRSNIDGNVKALKNWGTSVISTAEHSVLNNSARNDGLNVRTIEISEAFTTSADNADVIKKVTSANYGHVMPLIAQYLLNREQEVIQWFHTEHQWFKTKLENETSHTGIRMFKRYATITTSARILERVIATPIDLEAIRNYLLNYHSDSVSERSLADKALETITQFVAQNRGKFSDDNRLSTMVENYGLIELKDNCIQVKILKDVFKRMLEENQYQDVNNVIDALRDKGHIQSDPNRKTTKRSIKDAHGKSKTIVFYHLKLDKELAPIFGLSSHVEAFTPPQFDGNTNPDLLNEFVKKARDIEAKDDLEL
ncbi:cassette chromosome replicative helicase [Staphylococcus hominis]|uniref:cassette chromosome replicative helicase n=1 Tax=Staphylococcus hominis TaxID=1290 RepID=UPI003F4930D3